MKVTADSFNILHHLRHIPEDIIIDFLKDVIPGRLCLYEICVVYMTRAKGFAFRYEGKYFILGEYLQEVG